MSFILVAAQRMLNVACNGSVYIFVGAFFAGKGRGFIVMDTTKAHGAAVADIFVNALDSENRRKLAVRDEGCMQ